MPWYRLLKGELRRELILLGRYPMEPFANLAVVLVLFMTIYASATRNGALSAASNKALGDAVLGYVLWFFAINGLTGLGGRLQQEATLGTLEQLCLMSRGFVRLWCARVLVDALFSGVQSLLLLTAIHAIAGVRISFPALVLVPLLCTAVAIQGFGLGYAAVALVFRRVEELRTLLHMLFLGLAIIDVSLLPTWARHLVLLLPFNQGLEMIRGVARQPVNVQSILRDGMPLLCFVAAAYWAAGLACLLAAYRQARIRGLLARY